MGDSLIVNQTVSNVAQLTFPVMVEDEPLAFTVMGPEDMNLVEGGMSAMVTVTANRGVDADTEVMLMRDGASVAGMDDVMVMPEMATIMAGDMMAEFEVMAVEDEMMEEMEGADPVRSGRRYADRPHRDVLPLGCRGAGPAAHRAASAGGLPGPRRIPALPAAVAFGGGVRNSPLPPLPRSPGGEGGFFVSAAAGAGRSAREPGWAGTRFPSFQDYSSP